MTPIIDPTSDEKSVTKVKFVDPCREVDCIKLKLFFLIILSRTAEIILLQTLTFLLDLMNLIIFFTFLSELNDYPDMVLTKKT